MASPLLSVEEALARILADASPLGTERITIDAAHDRILAEPLAARLTQPPFDASAMDGYAVRAADVAQLPAKLTVIGESAAGHPFFGRVGQGEAVRIFTGAPVPEGADGIVIQEHTTREGAQVLVQGDDVQTDHIRPRGGDFREGLRLLDAGRRLGPRELSLAAAMGHGEVVVYRRPKVAILSTGDELVRPGETPGTGQIVASNHLGVGAMVRGFGAEVIQLGIARDTAESLNAHVARAKDADILVTIGGASVGDHDLVAPVLSKQGMELAFWKIAMRPGKPLMSGRLGNLRVIGLPGNPVSALVCARVFLVPLVEHLAGRAEASEATRLAEAAVAIEANGPRQHYMRATLAGDGDGLPRVTPVRSQDSSLLSPLAIADCLIVRSPKSPAVVPGETVRVLPLDF
ncbi:gephyrin-like molybdotransferase Glp [Hyphomicrobium sp. CS1BSMeth3]|uniref:molybdopterin molybdotransferase MoeA n=1 Tax=Hyphomicrobium sp. CS1BSMeth3 TaxID=1892844 RepID=UPI0009317534|nr:gephyrin-like molybdotransferase Glp [Hyphomicrobium sp. CS1BSMeth3]